MEVRAIELSDGDHIVIDPGGPGQKFSGVVEDLKVWKNKVTLTCRYSSARKLQCIYDINEKITKIK